MFRRIAMLAIPDETIATDERIVTRAIWVYLHKKQENSNDAAAIPIAKIAAETIGKITIGAPNPNGPIPRPTNASARAKRNLFLPASLGVNSRNKIMHIAVKLKTMGASTTVAPEGNVHR